MANLAKHKILSFAQLEDKWCYGEGVSFSKSILKKALALYNTSQIAHFSSTDAFPGLSGEVTLSLYSGKDYYEFTLETDYSVTFVHEIEDELTEYTKNLSFANAERKIIELGIGVNSWSSYELSTQSFMTDTKIESRAMPLEMQKMESSPFLKKTVLSPLKKVYVSISEPIMKPLFPQCTGSSRKIFYPIVLT